MLVWMLNEPFSKTLGYYGRVLLFIREKCFNLYYFRIKQEWDIMLECRKKGIPQATYLNNGFIDTNKILDNLEKNSTLIKKIALLDETEKERNKFIFQLSGEHWTVSLHQLCLHGRNI